MPFFIIYMKVPQRNPHTILLDINYRTTRSRAGLQHYKGVGGRINSHTCLFDSCKVKCIRTFLTRCTSVLWPKTDADEIAALLPYLAAFFCGLNPKCLRCKSGEHIRGRNRFWYSNTSMLQRKQRHVEVLFCYRTVWAERPFFYPKDILSGDWKRKRSRDRWVLQQALQQEQQRKLSSLSASLSRFVRITRRINKSSQSSESWMWDGLQKKRCWGPTGWEEDRKEAGMKEGSWGKRVKCGEPSSQERLYNPSSLLHPFPAFFSSFNIFLLFSFLSLTPRHALPSAPETLWKRVPTQQFPDPFFSLLSPPSLSLRRKLSTFPPGCLFLGLPETAGQYPMDSLRLSSFSSMLDLSAPLS